MSIRTYLVRRLALLVLVLVGISLITFLLVRVVPSDPAAIYAGPRARAEQIAQARHILGLDRPLYAAVRHLRARPHAGRLGHVAAHPATGARRHPALPALLAAADLLLSPHLGDPGHHPGSAHGAHEGEMGRPRDARLRHRRRLAAHLLPRHRAADHLLPHAGAAAGLGRARHRRRPGAPGDADNRHDGGRCPDHRQLRGLLQRHAASHPAGDSPWPPSRPASSPG